MKELLILILLGLPETQSQTGDYRGRSSNPVAKDHLAGGNIGTSLPDFAALLTDPVIIGVGDTPGHGTHLALKGIHIDAPIQPIGSPLDHLQTAPGVIHLDTGAHIDFHNEHGNKHGVPVIHTPDGRRTPVDPIAGKPGIHSIHPVDPTLTNIEKHLPQSEVPGVAILDTGEHIDFKHEHGNVLPVPVIHKPDGRRIPVEPLGGKPGIHNALPVDKTIKHIETHLPQPQVTNLDRGEHIDFTHEHGNVLPVPVIHKPDGRRVPVESSAGQIGAHHQIPAVIGNIHAETQIKHVESVPGIGNIQPNHQVGFQSKQLPPDFSQVPQHSNVKVGTGAHIDLPGEHNNLGIEAVLHTSDGKRFTVDPLFSDLDPNALPIMKPPGNGQLPKGAHVDFQGQHGNKHPKPVIHLPDESHVHLDNAAKHTSNKPIHGIGKAVIEHIHTDVINAHAVPMKKFLGEAPLQKGAHVDFQGQHGNKHAKPVIHLPDESHVHLDTAAKSIFNKPTHSIGQTVIEHLHTNVINTHAVPMKNLPGVAPLDKGAHVDFKGQHGNTHEKPVIHLPTGQHLHFETAVGPTMGKVVPDIGVKIPTEPYIKPNFPILDVNPPSLIPNRHRLPADVFPVADSRSIIKPDFPPITPVNVKPEFLPEPGPPAHIKSSITPVDAIPDLFGPDTRFTHQTELISQEDILPKLTPIKTLKPEQSSLNQQLRSVRKLRKIVDNSLPDSLLQQQLRKRQLEHLFSKPKGNIDKGFTKPINLPPLKPIRGERPRKKFNGFKRNRFRQKPRGRRNNRGRGRVIRRFSGRGRRGRGHHF